MFMKNGENWWLNPVFITAAAVGGGLWGCPVLYDMAREVMGLRASAPEAIPAGPPDYSKIFPQSKIDGLVCDSTIGGSRNETNVGCVLVGPGSWQHQIENKVPVVKGVIEFGKNIGDQAKIVWDLYLSK